MVTCYGTELHADQEIIPGIHTKIFQSAASRQKLQLCSRRVNIYMWFDDIVSKFKSTLSLCATILGNEW